MPDIQSFQRMIHTPEFWQADESDREAMWSQYTSVQEADVTPVNAYQLGLLALQEMVRMGMIVKAMALEQQPEPPKRRGRPPKVNGDAPAPEPSRNGRAREISVSANDGRVELMNRKLSADEARELGARLIEAANTIDGSAE
jgi:hypothetical protein